MSSTTAEVQGSLAAIAGQLQHINDQLGQGLTVEQAIQVQANMQAEIARLTALSAGALPSPLAEPGEAPAGPDPLLQMMNEDLADLAELIRKLEAQVTMLQLAVSKLSGLAEATAEPKPAEAPADAHTGPSTPETPATTEQP